MSPDPSVEPQQSAAIADVVAALMPQLREDLADLVAIPSISALGYPEETRPEILRAHDAVAALFRDVGVEVSVLELPDTAPVVIGEIPAPEGAPTVLLYGHYDVVPAGPDEEWESPPYQLTERDGALFGRGSADTKSNIVAHVGALRVWNGKPPVGIKLVIEGQEEVGGGALLDYPATDPELFRADAMLIADMGSVRPGVPTLTIGLRGMALVDDGGGDARRPEAQRPVRRSGPGCGRRSRAGARHAARRERRCGRGGAPTSSRGQGRPVRGGVPDARRDPRRVPARRHG